MDTVTIYDPDYAGNRVVAYDVNGTALQTVNFTGDNWPGVLTTETQSLTADGIRRIDLIPSTGIHEGDLVAYDMNFSPDSTCDPLYADPILEAANVRSALNQEYTDGLQQGKERGGWVYQNNTTGEYLAEPELNPIHRDACEILTPYQVPPKAGYTGVGSYHTHVLNGGQTAPAGCLNVPAGTTMLNGPSPGDLNFPTQSGVPDYTIDSDEVFTIDQLGNVAPQPWTRDNFCRS